MRRPDAPRSKADKLRALIDHPTTPEGERAAAREALRQLSAARDVESAESSEHESAEAQSREFLRLGGFPVMLARGGPRGQCYLLQNVWLIVHPDDWPTLLAHFEGTGSVEKAIAALAEPRSEP